jgi:pimeloyl-ACP methyl ester carboxylesterase
VSEHRYHEFHWLERGEGEPLVLLHGLVSRMDHWEEVLEALEDACRPMAVALPIFERALREPSIQELGLFVRDFLQALEIPRAVVGGNSLGGHVALQVALTFPSLVGGLVLTGSSGLFERSFTRGVPHRPSADYVRQKMEEVFFDSRMVTPEWVEAVREAATTPFSALRILHFARAAKRHNVEGRLFGIQVPTLLVWGCDDRITPPDVARRFRDLIPDAELVFLANCGHAPMLEQPEAFAEAVEHWLARSRRRRQRASLAMAAGSAR